MSLNSLRRSVTLIRQILLGLAASAFLQFLACNESVSPRNDPETIFSTWLEVDPNVRDTIPRYAFYLAVQNQYDETLADEAILKGTISLVSLADSTVRVTLPVSAANILFFKNYDTVTKYLTIEPNDTVRFRVEWDLIADNGRRLEEDFFRFHPDPFCSLRLISSPQWFEASVELEVFSRAPLARIRRRAQKICIASNYVPTTKCMPIPLGRACELIGQ